MPAQIQTPAAAPGPMPPQAATNVPGQAMVPFVRAAGATRTAISVADNGTLTAAQQPITQSLPGTGYMVWLDLFLILTSTGNASGNAVVYAEDSPWSAFASITLDDGGPQMVNIDGFSLHLLDIYGGFGQLQPTTSADPNVYSVSAGTAATAGSTVFRLRIPAAINERDYWGLLGNQDRATKYNLRDDVAQLAAIYATAPTNAPTFNLRREYAFLPVPGPQNALGQAQQQIPDNYGIVHYLTSVRSEAIPTPGAPINHYLRNLSNAVRLIILVFRQGSGATPRAAAEAALPTQIEFRVGTDVLFTENAPVRRGMMWDRYRFDAPPGVLVYDFLEDFGPLAGYELGDDYLFLGNVSEAQFAITYPAGFTASASNSLTIVTDSLYIPPGLDIYGMQLPR